MTLGFEDFDRGNRFLLRDLSGSIMGSPIGYYRVLS